jgi:hypothetical protein
MRCDGSRLRFRDKPDVCGATTNEIERLAAVGGRAKIQYILFIL